MAEVSFLNTVILGVRLWILLYFLFSIFMGVLVAIYFFKERLKKKYYELRYPEKLIKVVMHYKSGMFKEYWRLIPDDNIIIAEKKYYSFSETQLTSTAKEIIDVKRKQEDFEIIIDKKKYELKNKHLLIKRWRSYPEVHYLFNVPTPIVFNVKNKKIELSAKQLEEFNENNLFAKLLTSERDKSMLKILFLVVIANIIGTIFIIAKLMEWLR